MWTLIAIVLTLTDITSAVVDKFPTLELCQAKKEVFEQEFKTAYPGDQDWLFACLLPSQTEIPSAKQPLPAANCKPPLGEAQDEAVMSHGQGYNLLPSGCI